MPYSGCPPPVVFPDTPEGRSDAALNGFDMAEVGFCRFYEQAQYAVPKPDYMVPLKNVCSARSLLGDRNHNWCFRCPAGYLVQTRREVNEVYGNEDATRPR